MASSIVTSAAQQLGTLLAEEAKYLYAVSDKIKNLKSELEWMHCFLQDVDIREHQENVARKWVVEIREFAYEAEDLIERYVCEVSHHRRNGIWNTVKWFSCVCGDAVTLHDIGSSLDDLSSRISKMVSRLQMYGVHISAKQHECSTCNFPMKKPQSSTYNIRRDTWSYSDDEPVGLDIDTEELVDKLVKEASVKVLYISGMSGSGKTTLARKVYLHKNVKQHFKNRVWVYVFEPLASFESQSVFEEILFGLSSNGEDQDARKIKRLTNGELQRRICEVLEKEDCLVVLDSIITKKWFFLEQAYESIKRGGSKILITTKNADMITGTDSYWYNHQMSTLTDYESWTLLQQIAFLRQKCTDVKGKLAKEMLGYCYGLPLAIVSLGGMLATKKADQVWESVKKSLSSQIMDDDDYGFPTLLELSYSDLPFYLKSCFMYLGMFPYGSEILADRLYHLWEVEGFISTSEEVSTDVLYDVAESYLNQLVRRGMVQVDKRWPDGRIKSCRLHGIMEAMCLRKCREANFVDIIERGSSKGNVSSSMNKIKSRRRAFHWIDHESDPFDAVGLNEGPYLRSFSVFSNKSFVVGKLLSQSMRKFLSLLRVLDLEGTVVSPQCDVGVIKYCIHLRYLSLRGMRGAKNRVPKIWDCIFLESLDLRIYSMCPIKLSNKLWKLGRLRNLYLPDDFVLVEDDLAGRRKLRLTPAQLGQMETLVNFNAEWCQIEGLRRMTNLRTFSFNTATIFIHDKEALEHLANSPGLKISHLRCSPFQLNVMAMAINEDPTILTPLESLDGCISELSICGRIDEASFRHLGDIRPIFPRRLKRLHLDNCVLPGEGILELEKLYLLEELKLSEVAIRGSKLSFSQESFRWLVQLTLRDMQALEEWQVGEEALPRLLYLVIRNCINLKMIPQNLPSSLKIHCYPSDINGSEKYMH